MSVRRPRNGSALIAMLLLLALVVGAPLAWYWPRGDEVWTADVGRCYQVTRAVGRAIVFREVACP